MKITGLTFFTIISADNDKTLFKWDVGDVEKEFCQNTQDLYVRYKVEKKDAHQVSTKNWGIPYYTLFKFLPKKIRKKNREMAFWPWEGMFDRSLEAELRVINK